MCLGLTGEFIYDIGFTWDLVDALDSRRSFHDEFWSIEGRLVLSIHWDIFDSFDLQGNDFDALDPLGIFLPFLDVFFNFLLHF